MRLKPKTYNELDNQEKVDLILEWVVERAPKRFNPQWTLEMQKILSTGETLTRRQKESIDNVFWGWEITNKTKWRKKCKK